MTELPDVAPEPLLQTLAPALRGLERQLRSWLETPHRFPIDTLERASLEGLASDLPRKADALQLEKPVLIIILMGGTGVGKSTLLNALAGGAIAKASIIRPTTHDPVVYYHESIQPHCLNASLRLCKLVAHSRPALEQKILVDTPDIDSNVLANLDKLMPILREADIVLFVSSPEKYLDKVGWKLFLEQRRRRAFAFVLNQWDLCRQPDDATGIPPDEDWLKNLKAQGFQNPLLFRTCAQHWVDHPEKYRDNGEPLIEGESFSKLVNWLEKGLTRREVEAIMARGVGQMLHHLEKSLDAVRPPDFTDVAERTREVWRKLLADEARAEAGVLLNTLEPYQKEVEHHFAMERQRLFHGPMATYLHLCNKLKYLGSTLRDHIPFRPMIGGSRVETQVSWDLAAFTLSCSKAAAEKYLDARNRDLANRLVVEGNAQGFINLLNEPTEATAKLDWSSRNAQAISEVMGQIETVWTKPTGIKRFVQGTVILLANYLPVLTFVAMVVILLGTLVSQYFKNIFGEPNAGMFTFLLLPPFLVIILLHVLISFVLPLHWKAIRADLETHLEKQLQGDLEKAFCPIPDEVARALLQERQDVERFAGEVRKVTGWLEKSEKSASIHDLFGD